MNRTKVFAPAAKAAPAPAPAPTRPERTPAPGGIPLVVQRAAAPRPAPPHPKQEPAAGLAEVNQSNDFAAAGVVPRGKPASGGRVELVAPGAAYAPPPGMDLRCFIHRDGSAVKFAGAAGAVHLDAAEVEREYGALVAQARTLFAAHPAPARAPARAAVSRSADTPAADAAAGDTAAFGQAVAASAARPLPTAARSRLEGPFGTDLGGVRVHTDGAADQAARAVHAHAFTTGRDIYFRSGQYRPDSADGQKLLAHEVAHTVQQSSGPAPLARQADPTELNVSEPGDRLEREAEAAADRAVNGKPAVVRPVTGGAGLARRIADPEPAPVVSPTRPATPAPKAPPAPKPVKPGRPPAPEGPPHGADKSGAAVPSKDEAPAAPPGPGPGPDAGPAAKGGRGSERGKPRDGEESGAAGKPAGPGAAPPAPAPAAPGPAPAEGAAALDGGAAAGPAPDAGLRSVIGDVRSAGREEREHDPAEKKAEEAKAAAAGPPNEVEGEAKRRQVDAMSGRKPGKFNRQAFKEAVRKKIQEVQVKSLSDVKQVKDGDQAQGIATAVKGEVATGKEATSGGLTQAVRQAPDPSGIAPTKGADLPADKPAGPPAVDGARAVPPPVPDRRLDTGPEGRAVDKQMGDAKVTPEQLRNANEPEFQAALDTKTSAQDQAKALPGSARAGEQAVIARAKTDAATATQTGVAGMHDKRADALAAAHGLQAGGKGEHEAARTRLAGRFEAIYKTTKDAVDARLAKLDTDVNQTFDDGASSAKTSFYWFLAKELLVYVAGGWVVDLFSKDNEYLAIFERGRRQFAADMEAVIDKVADVVETGLNDVVDLIARGKADLDTEVAKLPEGERAVGREVADGVQGKFTDLEKSVEQKQTQIIDSLAQKYVQAQKDVDSVVDTLKDPVGAAFQAAADAIGGVIDTIKKMRALLEGVLAKAGEAIDLILADPIGFAGNLAAGVKQGLMNFVGNIGTHLQKGLFEWLFGTLAAAGVQVPDKFDLSGILSIVLQVLGLTYANFRRRAVAIVGEKVVSALETASEVFITLVTKGPAGLWEYIKDKAATLLQSVLDGIKTFLIEKVIVAGVTWVIGLLNPASAFVKACKAIYDIVMFFVERGQQILDLVNAVLDSVLSIARGSIGVAASAVEKALARAVPVAIGFLAGLLGLGGLSEKIKEVIDKIQAPINAAIDWVIKQAVGLVKAVGRMLGFGKEKPAEKPGGPLEDVTVQERFSMGAEGHSLTASTHGGQLKITIASAEVVLQAALGQAITQVRGDSEFPKRKEILGRLEQALVLSDYNTILQQWHDQQQPGRLPDFLKRRVLQIIASLSDLGGLGITSLDELFGKLRRGNGPYSHLPDTELVGPKLPFTGTQRRTVLEENRRIYGVASPLAVSDQSKVQLDDSLPAAHPNKPNVDHIFPRTEGGPNSYSNAKVLARDENAAKGATITEPLPFEVKEKPASPRVIRRPRPQTPQE